MAAHAVAVALRRGAHSQPRHGAEELSARLVEEALASAEAAGYRIDALLEIGSTEYCQHLHLPNPTAGRPGRLRVCRPERIEATRAELVDPKDAKTTGLDSRAE